MKNTHGASMILATLMSIAFIAGILRMNTADAETPEMSPAPEITHGNVLGFTVSGQWNCIENPDKYQYPLHAPDSNEIIGNVETQIAAFRKNMEDGKFYDVILSKSTLSINENNKWYYDDFKIQIVPLPLGSSQADIEWFYPENLNSTSQSALSLSAGTDCSISYQESWDNKSVRFNNTTDSTDDIFELNYSFDPSVSPNDICKHTVLRSAVAYISTEPSYELSFIASSSFQLEKEHGFLYKALVGLFSKLKEYKAYDLGDIEYCRVKLDGDKYTKLLSSNHSSGWGAFAEGAFVDSITETTQPVTQTTVTQTTKPITQTTKPVTQTAKPVTQATKPVTQMQTTKPVTQATKPVTQTAKPVTQTTKPVTQTAKPVTQTAKPVTQATKPVTQATKPVTQATKPVTQATKPAAHIEENVPYYLVPLSNEKTCMTASGSKDGANVSAEKICGSPEQQWTFERVGENRYNIVNCGNKKLLNMLVWKLKDVKNFTNITTYSRSGDDNTQIFSVQPYESYGNVFAVSAADMPYMRVDVYGAIDKSKGKNGTKVGANIQLYEKMTDQNQITQLFRLIPVNES